jgi:DeoR family transcriptional regulator, fructose operon transcriptional repressor
VRVAHRRVFVGVHTKFGVCTFCRFAEVVDLETIITDMSLPATEAHRYSLLGPQVVRV